jgi:hypothetical protein
MIIENTTWLLLNVGIKTNISRISEKGTIEGHN